MSYLSLGFGSRALAPIAPGQPSFAHVVELEAEAALAVAGTAGGTESMTRLLLAGSGRSSARPNRCPHA